jgi:hypothetical protein
MAGYYARQTCVNGHIVSNFVDGTCDDLTQPFCSKCGAKTIIKCPSCNAPQHGSLIDVVTSDKKPDNYCWNCGKPYPWTEKCLQAAEELIREDESLGTEDKNRLAAALPDMTSENPRTTLAATRFKRIIKGMGRGVGESVQKIMIEIASETAKKIILGQ